MKNSRIVFFFIISIALFNSCTKDDDNATPTGTSSPSDPRNSYIGNWVCNETNNSDSSSTTFGVEIFAHSSIASRIVTSNFNNLGFQQPNCQMEVSGNSITIFQQNLSGFTVVGSGNLQNTSTIVLNYSVDDGSGILDNMSATLTKTN